jgi:SHAQKYF class myb-like DNA-binding protein
MSSVGPSSFLKLDSPLRIISGAIRPPPTTLSLRDQLKLQSLNLARHVTEIPQEESRTGRWTEEECAMFERGLELYGKDWKQIQQLVRTRELTQVRTHWQKLKRRLEIDLRNSMKPETRNVEIEFRCQALLKAGESKKEYSDLASRVRPRTDPTTGERQHFSSADPNTPTHRDKRQAPGCAHTGEIDPRRIWKQDIECDRAEGWFTTEEMYAERLIYLFNTGTLEAAGAGIQRALRPDTTLLVYLNSKLAPGIQQIQSKFGAACNLQKRYTHRGSHTAAEATALLLCERKAFYERKVEENRRDGAGPAKEKYHSGISDTHIDDGCGENERDYDRVCDGREEFASSMSSGFISETEELDAERSNGDQCRNSSESLANASRLRPLPPSTTSAGTEMIANAHKCAQKEKEKEQKLTQKEKAKWQREQQEQMRRWKPVGKKKGRRVQPDRKRDLKSEIEEDERFFMALLSLNSSKPSGFVSETEEASDDDSDADDDQIMGEPAREEEDTGGRGNRAAYASIVGKDRARSSQHCSTITSMFGSTSPISNSSHSDRASFGSTGSLDRASFGSASSNSSARGGFVSSTSVSGRTTFGSASARRGVGSNTQALGRAMFGSNSSTSCRVAFESSLSNSSCEWNLQPPNEEADMQEVQVEPIAWQPPA